ncbi:conjugal transfer protein TraH [Amycolatopsis sp. NPDC051128]|uniref:conjugal transfer protein TraH n=1 Tax=Amycolatopsis sp. NPDC051128 TaxID=3155412 RepID=UPI00342FCE34
MTRDTPQRDRSCRTRQETAVAWCGSHVIELAGVGVPLIGGVVFTPWLDLLSAVVAALWVRHEVLVHRRTAAARKARATVLGTIPVARLTDGTPDTDTTTPAAPAGTEPAPADEAVARNRREVTR